MKVTPTGPLHVSLTLARTVSFDGRVVDQHGTPAAGVSLWVTGRSMAETGADGRFHVDAFPAGLRGIVVAFSGLVDRTRWTGRQEPETVDAARGPVTITMWRRPGSVDVRVTVVDATTGQLLEPAQASLLLFLEEREMYLLLKDTEMQRGLVTAKDCAAGRWRLGVRTADGQRGWLDFTLAEGQPPQELRLELLAPGTIVGRLRFAGTPPHSIMLDVQHETTREAALVDVRFHQAGRWQVDAATQTVSNNEVGHTGSLHLQPARNAAFQLASADPIDTLVFMVHGEGVSGEARVHIQPGETREIVIDVQPARVPR
jgi:hypothetical protein